MITPFDIENKEFSKVMRGYSADEVDEFLDEIILDLQKLLVENEKMKGEIAALKADLNQYKKSESSVLSTLESAKKLMTDISESAERRAEIIIKNAQMDAEVITKDARDSISKLLEEGEHLKEKVGRYRSRYRQFLEEEINRLEGSSEELFEDLEKEFVPASMTEAAAGTAAKAVKETVVIEKPEAKKETVTKETIVLDDKSLEELLAEDFGVEPPKNDDLTKTRIIK